MSKSAKPGVYARAKMFAARRTRSEWIALAAIALFIVLFFKPVVAGDGFGYYTVLEGAVRDHTLNLSQQYHYNNVTNGSTVFFYAPSGVYATQYAPGLAIASAPLYAVSLVLDDFRVFHVSDSFFIAERGDILVHMASVALTSLIFVAVALLLGLELLGRLGLKRHAPLALLAAFFGTPLIRYATYDLTYTHAIEAGILAIAVFIFFTDDKKSLLIGAVMGAMTLVRYTSIALLVPFLAYYAWRKRWRDAALAVAGAVPFVLGVMSYWWAQFGSPFITSYTASGSLTGNISLIPWGIGNVLFSMQPDPQALAWWTPICIIALIGLALWENRRKWVLLGLFAVMLWVTGSSFHGTTGFSFSHRYFAALFIVFLIGTAVLLDKFVKAKWLVAAATAWTVLLFVLHLAGEYSSFATLQSVYAYWFNGGRLGELPSKLYGKLGVIRLLANK